MQKTALVTGISGQDGWYLAEFLGAQGYAVHGLVEWDRRELCPPGVVLHYADLCDGSNLLSIVEAVAPDEVYHLAAQSHVRLSFDLPILTAEVTGLGVLKMLEAVRLGQDRLGKTIRFYQASSSEMFGDAVTSPQNEQTPFRPRSPYACAKVYGYFQTVNYREAHGLFAVNGILFNHESPRRGPEFVTRKITMAAARIKENLQHELRLGNIEARRDWGFAGDYVRAMWQMMQHEVPDDFVIATGTTHSVADFLEAAFGLLDLDWRKYVVHDPQLLRPTEVRDLCGDASKARRILGWEPTVDFSGLVKMMVEADLAAVRRERR